MTSLPTDVEIIRTVADDLPVGVWVARAPDGQEVYANKMFAEIMGTSALDVAAGGYAAPYGIHDRSGALYAEAKMPFVRALLEKQTVVVDDIVVHRRDGGRVYVRAQARPVLDGDGAVTHVVIAFIDITREATAEEARAESEARLRRAQRMESVGQLAGGIAHDFNNMLAVIKGLAALIAKDETDPQKRADLATIDDVTRSAVQLTRSLLGFAGRVKKKNEPVSVNDVVRSIGGMLGRTLERSIDLVLDLQATRAVVGDFSMLEQVVMNLAVNARDAMPEGGELRIATRDEGASVVLEVTDTGVGIPPALRERVFEPYFTTKASGSQKGTGLGLATVYGIVSAHGGTIEVRDGAPRGTRMRLALPATDVAPVQPESSHDGDVPRGRGLVLLVEDEPLVRDAAARVVASLGYEVVAAADGAQAVALLRTHGARVVAVVLDRSMPRMDGRATFSALRAIDPGVPVIVTSGFAHDQEAQALLDLGADAFVEKPWPTRHFAEQLVRLVARRAPPPPQKENA